MQELRARLPYPETITAAANNEKRSAIERSYVEVADIRNFRIS